MRLHAVFAAGILRSAPYPVSPASVPIELHALGTRLLLPVIDELFEFRFGFRLSNELASNRPILIGRLPIVRETRTARRLSLTFLLTYFFLFFLRERGTFGCRVESGGIGWNFPLVSTILPIPSASFFDSCVHPISTRHGTGDERSGDDAGGDSGVSTGRDKLGDHGRDVVQADLAIRDRTLEGRHLLLQKYWSALVTVNSSLHVPHKAIRNRGIRGTSARIDPSGVTAINFTPIASCSSVIRSKGNSPFGIREQVFTSK